MARKSKSQEQVPQFIVAIVNTLFHVPAESVKRTDVGDNTLRYSEQNGIWASFEKANQLGTMVVSDEAVHMVRASKLIQGELASPPSSDGKFVTFQMANGDSFRFLTNEVNFVLTSEEIPMVGAEADGDVDPADMDDAGDDFESKNKRKSKNEKASKKSKAIESDEGDDDTDFDFGSDDSDPEDEPAPKKKSKRVIEEEEDDEPAPKKKSKKVVDEDDDLGAEDFFASNDDEEDDEPAPKKKSKKVVDEDDEEDFDAAPKKKSKRVIEEEEDDEPAPKKKSKKVVDDLDDEDGFEEAISNVKAGKRKPSFLD